MKEVPFLLEIVIKNKLTVKNWNQISKPQLYIDGFFAYSIWEEWFSGLLIVEQNISLY